MRVSDRCELFGHAGRAELIRDKKAWACDGIGRTQLEGQPRALCRRLLTFNANLRGLDQPLEAALSFFEVLLRVVEALEHLFVASCAEFLTAIDSVFDDSGDSVYPIRHLV